MLLQVVQTLWTPDIVIKRILNFYFFVDVFNILFIYIDTVF